MHATGHRQEIDPGQVIAPSSIESVERALTRLVRLAETRRAVDPEQSPENRLDRAAYALLSRLEECPRTRLTELAALLEIDLSTASRQVRGLTDRGLVARVGDPGDQRAAGLELTNAGRAALCATRALRVERITTRLANWEQRDVDELARLLSRLVASFTDKTVDPPISAPAPRHALSGAPR
jgi:DNA-binding MarR family transcriptional regulator